MVNTEFQAIYIMWLREMKRFSRSKSRIVGVIIQPLFFLFILGVGLMGTNLPGVTGSSMDFIAPGVVTMAILFSSMFTGISVLWDKQFGFLQEVLVAPISRLSIIIGRTFGGATIALFQGFIILIISILLGVKLSGVLGLILTIIFMVLVSFTAVGFGLILASKMRDFQGFQIIMNLIVMPLFFLSSAIVPIATNKNIPEFLTGIVSYANPIFYMVDGLRGSLTGINSVFHPLVDLVIVFSICSIMMGLGTYFFSKSEA